MPGVEASRAGFVTSGVMGGIVTIVIAVVWLGVELLTLDKIFFCPAILLILGVFGIVKRLISGEE